MSDILAYNLRCYLYVPYAQKEEAKLLGAKWDPSRKSWYILGNEDTHKFKKWFPKLEIELIPDTLSGINMRSYLSMAEWKKIREEVIQRSKFKCEICNISYNKASFECHEVWQYDYTTLTQYLTDFQALCTDCHSVKHIGFSMHTNNLSNGLKVLEHLGNVNNWNVASILSHINDHLRINRYRNELAWSQDLTSKIILTNTQNRLIMHCKDEL